jgi:hypothetical protein
MSDFSSEDLFEATDRAVNELLDRCRVVEPPVDALEILRTAFDFRISFDEPHGAPRYGDHSKRRAGPNELILQPDQSEETQQTLAARTIAKKLIPAILTRVGVVPGTENKSAMQSLVGLVTSRLLLPSRWFVADARRAAFDLAELKGRYATAGWETLAWRLLDADDEPSVVAILDDGSVTARRGNRFSVGRTLTAAEQECLARVQETDDPVTVRRDGWTATGWPTQGAPFRRILVRSVPDQV